MNSMRRMALGVPLSSRRRAHAKAALAGGALFLAVAQAVAGPYTEPGVPSSSASFVGWATRVSQLIRGPQNIDNPAGPVASFGTEAAALGVANNNPVSLGDGGYATLEFAFPIRNGAGPDFAVFENGFTSGGGVFAELGYVEVSSNGADFFRFPSISLTSTTTQVGGFGVLDPTNIYNLAGKHVALQGTPFDLQELVDVSVLLDVDAITHVRVRDVVGRISPVGDYSPQLDSLGTPINEPYPTPFASGGFDLDAVGVINAVPEPSSLALLGLGALAMRRRRRFASAFEARSTTRALREQSVTGALVLSALVAAPAMAHQWASQLITSQTFGPFHSSSLWNDPAAVLGPVNTIDRDDTTFTNPSWREIHMAWPAWHRGSRDPSLVGTPHSAAQGTNNGIGLRRGSQVTVAFDQPVMDNPDDAGSYNWGIDFIVHGNSFFVGQGATFPGTDMGTYRLASGGVFAEPVTISVAQSLDGPWYTFQTPTADNYFPTQPYAWDRAARDWSTQELDWFKPVDPGLGAADFAGLTVADAIDLYGGSAGGTGFDISDFGLDWIQYVRLTDPSGLQGEICGIVDVAVPEPATGLLAVAVILSGHVRKRR